MREFNPVMASDFRYLRQTNLKEVGAGGQLALSRARVLCVGAGGLGSPALLYLAAAGVGTLGVADDDRVSLTNLQRQVLFSERDLDRSKAQAAMERLRAMNSGIDVRIHEVRVNPGNVRDLLSGYDLVLEASDNFATKYLLHDCSRSLGMPFVYSSIQRFEGQLASFHPARTGEACLRCLYPRPPSVPVANCAEAGILGPVAGVLGSLQALEAIRLILSRAPGAAALPSTTGTLFHFDAATLTSRRMAIPPRGDCRSTFDPACEDYAETLACERVPAGMENLKLAREGRTVVDVRDLEELEGGVLPGAVHFPLERIEAGESPPLGANGAVLYCASGLRSARAAQLLSQRGIQGCVSLEGGVLAFSGPLSPFGS